MRVSLGRPAGGAAGRSFLFIVHMYGSTGYQSVPSSCYSDASIAPAAPRTDVLAGLLVKAPARGEHDGGAGARHELRQERHLLPLELLSRVPRLRPLPARLI